MKGLVGTFLCLAALTEAALHPCYPNPSMKCSVKGTNLIGVYSNVRTEQFCAERCLDFEDCRWWTYHDEFSENDSNTCELFRRICEAVPSKHSRYDGRCGVLEASFVTLVIGGVDARGDPVEQVEAFDFNGACEKADFIKRPLELSLTPWKHASSFINYLNTIVSCGGLRLSGSEPSPGCLIYDFNKFKWYRDPSIVPDMLEPRMDFTMIYAYGEIFAMGGHDGVKSLSSVEIYNPMTRSWRMGHPMRQGVSNHCALKVKECIYVMGGRSEEDSPGTAFMGMYNVTHGSWRLLKPMNIGRLNHACTYDAERKQIIVSGGIQRGLLSYINTVSFYDLKFDTWTDSEDELQPSNERMIKQSITLFQGKEVIVDGKGRVDTLESIKMQDLSDNNFNFKARLQHDRKDFSWINVPQDMIVTGCHND